MYKSPRFHKWQRREKLSDKALLNAIREMDSGLVDATLGAGLFKKRVARSGAGKRGSYRTIVAARLNERHIFLYGFSKNQRSNINNNELQALKQLSAAYLKMSVEDIQQALRQQLLFEVEVEDE